MRPPLSLGYAQTRADDGYLTVVSSHGDEKPERLEIPARDQAITSRPGAAPAA